MSSSYLSNSILIPVKTGLTPHVSLEMNGQSVHVNLAPLSDGGMKGHSTMRPNTFVESTAVEFLSTLDPKVTMYLAFWTIPTLDVCSCTSSDINEGRFKLTGVSKIRYLTLDLDRDSMIEVCELARSGRFSHLRELTLKGYPSHFEDPKALYLSVLEAFQQYSELDLLDLSILYHKAIGLINSMRPKRLAIRSSQSYYSDIPSTVVGSKGLYAPERPDHPYLNVRHVEADLEYLGEIMAHVNEDHLKDFKVLYSDTGCNCTPEALLGSQELRAYIIGLTKRGKNVTVSSGVFNMLTKHESYLFSHTKPDDPEQRTELFYYPISDTKFKKIVHNGVHPIDTDTLDQLLNMGTEVESRKLGLTGSTLYFSRHAAVMGKEYILCNKEALNVRLNRVEIEQFVDDGRGLLTIELRSD
jgi:hypothetical protein